MKKMFTPEQMERVEKLIPADSLINLKVSISEIKSALLNQGWEDFDVALYLEEKISTIL